VTTENLKMIAADRPGELPPQFEFLLNALRIDSHKTKCRLMTP
jgi:hypothetical protein